MDTEKPKFNWQRMLTTISIVLFSALVVGGTTWYVMDKSAKEVQTANEKTATELQKQIDRLKTTQNTSKTNVSTTVSGNAANSIKTYTNSGTGVSFDYPLAYAVEDKTSLWVGTDENQFPWYSRADFAKAALEIVNPKADTLSVKIVDSTDMDKVLGSLGGGSPAKSLVSYGNYKGYVATAYGQGEGSPNIVYTLVGPKYSIAIMSVNPKDSDTIKSIMETVKFN